jgi:hypothetical protein
VKGRRKRLQLHQTGAKGGGRAGAAGGHLQDRKVVHRDKVVGGFFQQLKQLAATGQPIAEERRQTDQCRSRMLLMRVERQRQARRWTRTRRPWLGIDRGRIFRGIPKGQGKHALHIGIVWLDVRGLPELGDGAVIDLRETQFPGTPSSRQSLGRGLLDAVRHLVHRENIAGGRYCFEPDAVAHGLPERPSHAGDGAIETVVAYRGAAPAEFEQALARDENARCSRQSHQDLHHSRLHRRLACGAGDTAR